MTNLLDNIKKRRTFAIISHPDAGKTTLTEKLLLLGKAIQSAGTIKSKKSGTYATSDWMELEKQRGISVTTSVMQFPYNGYTVNLLDTPGHADFSEDTYRTLTAVDSVLMVIDGVKGVEERTIKLMDVCRLRATPIVTFINKFDRDTRDPVELMDEVESVLNIKCSPITWPIGMGKFFKGVYHLYNDEVILYKSGHGESLYDFEVIKGLNNPAVDDAIGDLAEDLRLEVDLVKGASHEFDSKLYDSGELTPVFFGTALSNFGIKEMLDKYLSLGPQPCSRESDVREIMPSESAFSGFIFKIQANMDPNHRDRIAFLRVCSGVYKKGMKLYHVRTGKNIQIANALTFMANDRDHVDNAYAGDVIGIHNHGGIKIGDTFTEGEKIKFLGIPNFAPEIFQKVRLKDPLKMKALLKGLIQLSEEGATQVFRPMNSNELILGAVGVLQFDVVAYRLANEYNVNCSYEGASISKARWVSSSNVKLLEEFKKKYIDNLSLDGAGELTYLASSGVNLQLAQERNPDIVFESIREH